jgi:hypothetical protein
MISGHCECNRVKFEVEAEISDFSHCHCSQCRRLHGAAYATFAGVPRDGFKYTAGETDISIYKSSPTHDRVFCGNCGSDIMVALTEEPDIYYLCMGVVDGDPALPAGYHIFVGSKAPWHEIVDDLDKYDAAPPE